MKVLAPTVAVTEVENEGLISMLEKNVAIFAMNYIYSGKLSGVNDKYVKLDDAAIVYETGSFTDKAWKDAQKLPNSVYVNIASIESFTLLH